VRKGKGEGSLFDQVIEGSGEVGIEFQTAKIYNSLHDPWPNTRLQSSSSNYIHIYSVLQLTKGSPEQKSPSPDQCPMICINWLPGDTPSFM